MSDIYNEDNVEITTGGNNLFQVALLAGYLVWLAATVLTGIFAQDGPWEGIAQFWSIAFLAGFLVTVSILTVRALIGGMSSESFLIGIAAYLLPGALVIIGWQAVTAIYPDSPQTAGIQAMAPLTLLIAYGVGLLFAYFHRSRNQRNFAVKTVLPPVIMALATLVYFSVEAFTSDSFVYRDAFDFGVHSAQLEDRTLTVEAGLTINKAGQYLFMASPLHNEVSSNEESKGDIIWIGSDHAPTEAGEYRLQLVWQNIPPQQSERILARAGSTISTPPYFGISRQGRKGTYFLRTFLIPLDVALQTSITGQDLPPAETGF